MRSRHKVSCVLCSLSEETSVTGALSTQNDVTAHQNCLLFSSGLLSENSPEIDDLFGFAVEDVLREVKRGKQLVCPKCKKKGATAGCEVKRCKKSYHYPCAVEDGAEPIEDLNSGKYVLYCQQHKRKNDNEPTPPENSVEAGPSKRNGARLSDSSSDSNSSNSLSCHKRRVSFSDQQRERSAKKRKILDSPSYSDGNESLATFAPLESDLDESANSVPEQQFTGNHIVVLTVSSSGDKPESGHGTTDEDDIVIVSDDESQSLLCPVGTSEELQLLPVAPTNAGMVVVKTEDLRMNNNGGCSTEERPVHSPNQQTDRHSTPQPSSPSLNHCERGRAGISTDSPEASCGFSSSPVNHLADPKIDSVSFWQGCTAAGCTQGIFADFINEMNNISSRIQSNTASQEDCDLALTVIKSSGKLFELLTKQQNELLKKQSDLIKAVASMEEVISTLRR